MVATIDELMYDEPAVSGGVVWWCGCMCVVLMCAISYVLCMIGLLNGFSILCFMLSIIARVKNLNNASSIFFFGSIGNMTLENYKSAVKDMDEKEMIDDLEEQIHTNSKLCSLKAKWYNKGIKFLLATVILWFVCMIFQLI